MRRCASWVGVVTTLVLLWVGRGDGACVRAMEVETVVRARADKIALHVEENGLVAGEAESFFEQTLQSKRAFHHVNESHQPDVKPDGDPVHIDDASGGGYLEILPDTRRTHADKLIPGENFSNAPGKLAVVKYHVRFANAGRYYVWVRAFSTGSEDNGLHVGLDGKWPASGQRLQWCEGKNGWRWESKQRTEKVHCGEPHKIYLDIEEPGDHIIHFSMREDGFEFDKWILTRDRDFERPSDQGPMPKVEWVAAKEAPVPASSKRGEDGKGTVSIKGEERVWHTITLDLDGPFAKEQDEAPNPFTDYRMEVKFTHADSTTYVVPGYFAADGHAAESSASEGTVWRCHFVPDRTGKWSYQVSFRRGKHAALIADLESSEAVQPWDGKQGKFSIAESDKVRPDLRAEGMLRYVGKHHLQFAGSGRYFLKAGADAPETLLAYKDFDGTVAGKPKNVPLKSWEPHVKDWSEGDPQWQSGKGKGLIGAINYLSGKGCNAFSFLTYNAGGDGDNVWPFVERNDKLHYDCSKLDQWGMVFGHGTRKGMYLHFKLQETEIDDDQRRHGGSSKDEQDRVPESLDGGDLGTERKLYCREIVARFGHNLALNWNIGEENTQSTKQQLAMIDYLAEIDPYHHPIVIHTFPDQQDKVYRPLLGDKSKLTGASLQNSSLQTTHRQTVKWVRESRQAGRPWVVAFDESGSAAHGQCPDLGYQGFDGKDKTGKYIYTQHEVRQQTLWGHLMGGGAGVEYYFGYQFAENDLLCQDWRSRDQSWDYCRIAIRFFEDNKIPFWEMENADSIIGNPDHNISKFCLAKAGEIYLVYLPTGGSTEIDLPEGHQFSVAWFNPREGGDLISGEMTSVQGGASTSIGAPPAAKDEDWLAVLRVVK